MEELVQEIQKGLHMGIFFIDHLKDKIDDQQFKETVLNEKKEYQMLLDKIHLKYPPIEQNDLMLEMMVDMKTMMTSDQSLAKMFIDGSNQAVMKMKHYLNDLDQQTELNSYVKEFEDISQKYMKQLDQYL